MVHLPNEIIANIISHLAPKGSGIHDHNVDSSSSPAHALAPYATVSRRWQECVEARTFAQVTLTSARLASPLAAQALTPDRVRRFVRSVQVDVLLPPYGEEARARREDEEDRARNDEVFTDVVRRVFRSLAGATADVHGGISHGDQAGGGGGGLEADGGGRRQPRQRAGVVDAGYRPKIRLSMEARCVSDREDLHARKRRWHVSLVRTHDIFEARYESSYLDLRPAAGKSVQDEVAALPELHCIQEFHVVATAGPSIRQITPRTVCLLASRMPGLESVHWELSDNEKRDVALRKRLRADFAHALQALPSSLQYFYLIYDRREPLDHSYQTPSILDETDRDNNDKLSLALHKLSQRLATFQLMGEVGFEILWPLDHTATEQQQQDTEPLWPRMRRYRIDPGVIAPSGEWRYHRDPDASDSESDDDDAVSEDPIDRDVVAPGDEREISFRSQLDPDAAHALLMAAARAARRMPALWTMEPMLYPPAAGGPWPLEVTYTVPANAARRAGDLARPAGGTAELLFESHPAFHPDEEVVQAWRQAAEEHTGAESGLVVVVKDAAEWCSNCGSCQRARQGHSG
jgi:hypothetical protein